MVYVTHKVTGFPRERVIGQGGALDSARWRTFIAMELGVSAEDVQGLVLGGHTDVGMVPLPRYFERRRDSPHGLARLRAHCQTHRSSAQGRNGDRSAPGEGSAYYAPSAAVITMIESILLDKKRIIPSSVLLQGSMD
jgi:malate dehydrogenase